MCLPPLHKFGGKLSPRPFYPLRNLANPPPLCLISMVPPQSPTLTLQACSPPLSTAPCTLLESHSLGGQNPLSWFSTFRVDTLAAGTGVSCEVGPGREGGRLLRKDGGTQQGLLLTRKVSGLGFFKVSRVGKKRVDSKALPTRREEGPHPVKTGQLHGKAGGPSWVDM